MDRFKSMVRHKPTTISWSDNLLLHFRIFSAALRAVSAPFPVFVVTFPSAFQYRSLVNA